MPERTPEGAKRQRSTRSEAESCADGLSWHNDPAEGELYKKRLGRNGTKWNGGRSVILNREGIVGRWSAGESVAFGTVKSGSIHMVGLSTKSVFSLRLIPTARRASRDLRDLSRSPDGVLERERLLQRSAQTKARRLSGRTRESSIVGLYGDVLRHTDGSYTRGYDLPLQPTMLAPDEVADAYIDGFAE